MIIATGSARPARGAQPRPVALYRERRSIGLGAPAIHHPMGPGAHFWVPVFGMAGLGRRSCPEGAVWSESKNDCVCRSGRVWMADKSRCVSPQAPILFSASRESAFSKAGDPVAFSTQQLHPQARSYLAARGYSVDCRPDPTWFAGPQGGVPPMMCSICGKAGCSTHKHGAAALNLNPAVATVEMRNMEAAAAAGVKRGTTAAMQPAAKAALQAARESLVQEYGSPFLPTGSAAAATGGARGANGSAAAAGNGAGASEITPGDDVTATGIPSGDSVRSGDAADPGTFDYRSRSNFVSDAAEGNGTTPARVTGDTMAQVQGFLSRSVHVGGVGIPYWLIAAAAVGGVLLFTRGGRRR